MAKKYYNTFSFVGEVVIPKDGVYSTQITDSGWQLHKLNFGIKDSSGSLEWVECFGGYNTKGKNKIYTIDNKKFKKMIVDWDSRFDKAFLDGVADFAKLSVSLGEGENKFISEVDFIEYLKDTLPKIAGQKVYAYGNVNLQPYKDKIYRKFNLKQIRFAKESDKDGLFGKVNVFFNSDAAEFDPDNEKIVMVNGFMQDYDRTIKSDRFFPQMFVINGEKLDFDNPKHKRRFDWMKANFDVGEGWYQLQWVVKFFNGANDSEISIEDLTDFQREQIELGIKTFEEIKSKMGGSFKDYSKKEVRLIKPTETFSEGADLTDYDDADFYYVKAKDENIKEIVKEEPKEKEQETIDIDDLF